MRGIRGFSLLEVILALVVALIVLVAMAGIWPQYARLAKRNLTRGAAVNIARQQLETTLAQGFAAAVPRTGFVTLEAVIKGVARDYRYDYQVLTNQPLGSNLKNVRVVVNWQIEGKTMSTELQTEMYNDGS